MYTDLASIYERAGRVEGRPGMKISEFIRIQIILY
jgi:vacuolar-type H+-ATPase subunit B/Vma2